MGGFIIALTDKQSGTQPSSTSQFQFYFWRMCRKVWGRKLRTIVLFIMLIIPAVAFAVEEEKCGSSGHGAGGSSGVGEEYVNTCSTLVPLTAGNDVGDPPVWNITIPSTFAFKYADVVVKYKPNRAINGLYPNITIEVCVEQATIQSTSMYNLIFIPASCQTKSTLSHYFSCNDTNPSNTPGEIIMSSHK